MKYATPPVALDQGLTAFPNRPTPDGVHPGMAFTWTRLARLIGPCVYYIRSQDDLVKIGFTRNLGSRRHEYRVPWDHLLAVTPGSYDDEQALHERFAVYRAHGHEWYWPTRPIIDHINEIRERLGVPAVDPW